MADSIPHVFTTSYLTDAPIRQHLDAHNNYDFDGTVRVSTGSSIGLRMIPTVRDLRFLWEETAQQVLDEQQQKVRESLRAALIDWAQATRRRQRLHRQPPHPVHPSGRPLVRDSQHAAQRDAQPDARRAARSFATLMLHNIDTLGANVDPGLLGMHIDRGAALSFEVIARRLEDRGGGLARVNGRPRLVEGLAMPNERGGIRSDVLQLDDHLDRHRPASRLRSV